MKSEKAEQKLRENKWLDDDPDYLKRRIPFWGWISCIPNRKVKHK